MILSWKASWLQKILGIGNLTLSKTLLCSKEYDKEIKGLDTEINNTEISLKFLFTVKFYSWKLTPKSFLWNPSYNIVKKMWK